MTTAPTSYRGAVDQRFAAVYGEVLRLAVSAGQRPADLTVLDFGCHNGHISLALGAHGCRVTALDCQHRVEGPNVTPSVRCVAADEIPRLGRFDVVLALSVLHHMDDWRLAFTNLRRAARRLMLVEVPHPHEQLRSARWKDALPELHATVASWCRHPELARTPATRQPDLIRGLWATSPLLSGTVFAGGGHHARSQQMFGHMFVKPLGYLPFQGSLNLKLDRDADLGPHQVYLQPDKKRKYRLWKARLPAHPDVSCHIMDVGARGHGPDCVELLAPVRLRSLGIETGSRVDVEVVW